MEKFKGTKGDWFITGHKNGRFLINQGSIEVWHSLVNVTREESKANALLISKAPEILEMLDILANCNPHHQRYQELRIAANNLIKQATEL